MAQHNQQSRKECYSIRNIWNPQKGATVQLSDPVHATTASRISETCEDQTESNPNQMLTTGQLVNAIGQIWGYASHPPSCKKSLENREVGFASSKKDVLVIASQSDGHQEHIVGSPCQKLQYEPDVSPSPMDSDIITATKISEEKIFSIVQISNNLKNTYKWMSHSPPWENNMSYNHLTGMQADCNVIDCSIQIDSKSCSSSYTDTENIPATVNEVSRKTTDSSSTMISQITFATSGSSKHLLFNGNGTCFHKADCLVRAINAIEQSTHLSRDSSSIPPGHYYGYPDRYTNTFEESAGKNDVHLNNWEINKGDKHYHSDMINNISAAACDKSQMSPVKQQHAVAGAMAGICVSLCLHPVDTVKTIVQSCHLDQKSVLDIGRSIVSERGLSGLYRGIASNIASSAPVSAIYTFTYESVKGLLLPLFPKEYCSVAHCAAGGCASVATSFIFTPSECIKQQMQVRSKYQNCWSALIGILQKGGLTSLYAGWGAVLCRNVPHSIIKFYAYENLKGSLMASLDCSELDTIQTLACGAVAGSTAAIFSTPFDVVKTRLQTQIPGSEHQYRGVFQVIQAIRKSEGFKGLYRGLAPRLIMYMTQGGLFFASYEFFKRALGPGASKHSN